MPGLSGNPHHNYDRHLRISQEAAWAVVNPDPSWQVCPILGDGYKLKGAAPRFYPDTNFGGWRQQVGIHHKLEVAGAHTMLAWPEATCYLLSAALDRDANGDLYSYTYDFYTPTDPRRVLGAVAETLAIRVTGLGDASVVLEVGWRAKTEARNAALELSDYDYSGVSAVPFMYRDGLLLIDAATEIDISDFTLSVNNSVQAGNLHLGRVAFLYAGRREVTLDLSKANIDRDNNDRIRGGAVCSFVANFTHPAGHLLQIQVPTLAVEEADESASATEITKEGPRMRALSSGGNDIIYGCDLAAGGTSTLAPITTTAAPSTTTTTAGE